MVENTMRSVLKAEHQLEHLAESSTGGSADETEKEFKEMRRITEQAALTALKSTETWGRQALNKTKEAWGNQASGKLKEHVEEISL